MDEEDGFFKEEICTLTPDELFDAFLQSCNLAETLDVFRKLCQSVDVNPRNHKTLYASLKSKLTSWKCKSLWTKLDKRAEQKDYKNKPCVKNRVLVIGAGPCGLRVAIEAALLGAYVVVIEKRDRFSRNNVLHLWPFLIVDLKNLGAKKFFGQFCAGAIDHISKYFIFFLGLYLCLYFRKCSSCLCRRNRSPLVSVHNVPICQTKLSQSSRCDDFIVATLVLRRFIFTSDILE